MGKSIKNFYFQLAWKVKRLTAELFLSSPNTRIHTRTYLRPYYMDHMNQSWAVKKGNIMYKAEAMPDKVLNPGVIKER